MLDGISGFPSSWLLAVVSTPVRISRDSNRRIPAIVILPTKQFPAENFLQQKKSQQLPKKSDSPSENTMDMSMLKGLSQATWMNNRFGTEQTPNTPSGMKSQFGKSGGLLLDRSHYYGAQSPSFQMSNLSGGLEKSSPSNL